MSPNLGITPPVVWFVGTEKQVVPDNIFSLSRRVISGVARGL